MKFLKSIASKARFLWRECRAYIDWRITIAYLVILAMTVNLPFWKFFVILVAVNAIDLLAFLQGRKRGKEVQKEIHLSARVSDVEFTEVPVETQKS